MNDTAYKPCGYYVLVKMDEVEEKSEGGIILATASGLKREQGGQCIGTVVAFGPAAYKGFEGCTSPDDWGVKIGDKFETNRYAGKPVMREGYENYRLITDAEIIATIREEH